MQSLILYTQELNPFTEKVACALAVKGAVYQRVDVSDSDEIKRLSPEKQTLPVLECDGVRIAESGKILSWIEDKFPEPSLFAADPKIRKQQEGLADWSDSNFAFYWNRYRAAADEHERAESSATPGLLSRIHQHVEEHLGIEPEDSIENNATVRQIMEELAHRMDDLVGFLGSRDYFFSDQLSAADIAVFGMLLVMRGGPMPGSAELLDARPTLAKHTTRLTKLTRKGEGIGQS